MIRQTQAGEMLEVTSDGEVVALLVPVRTEPEGAEGQGQRFALTSLDALRAEIAYYTSESSSAVSFVLGLGLPDDRSEGRSG
jgi:antitoxin (DNA-binding transcriptional repressor) of toxin-antitoxin stability system